MLGAGAASDRGGVQKGDVADEAVARERVAELDFAIEQTLPAIAAFRIAACGTAVRIAGCFRQIEVRWCATRDDIPEHPERKPAAAVFRERVIRAHVDVRLLPRRATAEKAVEERPIRHTR